MEKNSKLYLAYGSNLNLKQMNHRCPTAKVVGASVLPDCRLRFRGYPGKAFATVESAKGCSVPVLIWKIMKRDESNLDRYEGYPSHYRKETRTVEMNGKTVNAMIYIMNEKNPYNQPSPSYCRTILKGYSDAGFDPEVLNRYVTENLSAKNLARSSETNKAFDLDDTAMPGGISLSSMTAAIREQIMAIRDSGETNMFDVKTVQYLAYHRGFYDLVIYLEDHVKEYSHFILTGEET